MGAKLQLPQIPAHPGGGGGDHHQLGALQREGPDPLGEVAVVADVHAELDPEGGVEGDEPGVAGREVVLLDAGQGGSAHQGDVALAVNAQQFPVGPDHRGGVEQHALDGLFVDGRHQDDPTIPGHLLHPVGGGSGDRLGQLEVTGIHLKGEVDGVEQLLQADDLGALVGGLADQSLPLGGVGLLVIDGRHLDECGSDSGHTLSPVQEIRSVARVSAGRRFMKRPMPARPTNLPSVTTGSPRTSTVSGAPCRVMPS